ncbi:MAG TPA: pyridine nucleotide-disulfide oxidoreductase [Archaeoglobus profundus]|nr:pyridine nucleotide-disulfide oxidoreductase [Archaeoglobus profundus]HIP58142.1 pyridine nucleotide-disulfide oxidoreductase [Archaeoglobus profundus]
MKVVVIGGGIAGLEFIRHASRLPIDITLIEPKSYMTCQALLPEFISDKVSKDDINVKIKPYCDEKGVEFIKDWAESINNNVVLTRKGKSIEYDILVISVGTSLNYYGIKGAEKAYSVHTFEDTIKTKKALEKAEKIVVVGSGATGVEVACELSEEFDVALIERMDRILPMFNPKVSTFVKKILEKEGVAVYTSCTVTEIEEGCVVTNKGNIECDLVIWCAGLKPSDFVNKVNIPKINGWIAVDEFLRVNDRIFAIGDNSFVKIDNKIATKTALEAEMQAKHVADNIRRLLNNQKLKRYKIRSSLDEPIAFITLAKNGAILVYHKLVITRPLALLYRIKKYIVRRFISKYK